MSIREDLVASATQFLQDPSVANSTVENRISFLRTKNLTQEEIDAALTRVGITPPQTASAPAAAPAPVGAPQQQYYAQNYPPQYAAWQPPPPVPKRDWRDWFIMATVVGGVGYGMYALTKRYVYPLIAPPTPERLEQDKKSIEEQFDKAFSLVEQLAKDTEALKAAEEERTKKLDVALSDFESVVNELKSANRRRDDEAQRIRDDVTNLKDSIPRALDTQKDLTDTRLKEINAELTSLKTLISQRMAAPSTSSAASPAAGYMRTNSSSVPAQGAGVGRTTASPGPGPTANESQNVESPNGGEQAKPAGQTLGKGPLIGGKASIPAWQLAMANKASATSAPSSPAPTGGESGSASQPEA